jgi:hypothetical protein
MGAINVDEDEDTTVTSPVRDPTAYRQVTKIFKRELSAMMARPREGLLRFFTIRMTLVLVPLNESQRRSRSVACASSSHTATKRQLYRFLIELDLLAFHLVFFLRKLLRFPRARGGDGRLNATRQNLLLTGRQARPSLRVSSSH